MVQKTVQKQVQGSGQQGGTAEDDRMPQFMFKTRTGTGYLFRRGVPEDVRQTIGKREFKEKLSGDYRAACRQRDRLAHETTERIAAARNGLLRLRKNGFHIWDDLEVINEVTPDVAQRFYSTVFATTEIADIQRREAAAVGQQPGLEMGEAQEAHSESERLLRQALATGDCSAFQQVTHQTLYLNGYRLSDKLVGTVDEGRLLLAFVRAHLAGIGVVQARYNGEDPSVVIPAAPLKRPVGEPGTVVGTAKVMMLSAAIKEFLEHLPPSQEPMNEKHGFILPAFLEVVGDMPITELRQSHVKDFLLTVQMLPPRWSELRRKGGQSIRDLASQKWDKTLALKTYEGSYLASLRTFIERAVADWQDVGFPTTLTTNIPYHGSRTKTERKQRALRPDEIGLIFFNERMKEIVASPAKVHKFWLLAIGLYTGARVREICQINPQYDWGCQDGIWWLRFTNEPGDSPDQDVTKSVKTGKPRTIPMHAELVRLGLPDYLERMKCIGARRLFPQWAPTGGNAGAAPGKFVANYMRSIGLHGVENELGNAVRGSHSFRHTLLTYGRKNGVGLRCISGHKESSDNPVADGYEDETVLIPLSEMAERLAKLDYGVELPIPVPAQVRTAQHRQSQRSRAEAAAATKRRTG
ncbi:integrase [Burkholderia ubonensis]|nr:integrase [Burkholderia ubonensis]